MQLVCPECDHRYPLSTPCFLCECGELLEVLHASGRPEPAAGGPPVRGVWRHAHWVDPELEPAQRVSLEEGDTPLLASASIARYVGAADTWIKHEGRNPTGSFKDRGMTVAISRARVAGQRRVACASTGNTSASMAAYAAAAGLEAIVLLPDGKVASGKLSQALAHGARTLRIRGDFDVAMRLVRELAAEGEIGLMNSMNPFRLEGQKTILLEVLEQLASRPPDWFVFPAGNLGNCAAFGKALRELALAGRSERGPRLAAVQASGAAPFAHAFARGFDELRCVRAETRATAIRIGAPVSYRRAVRAIRETRGVVTHVDDEQIFAAKAVVDASGLGAEPASCASVAGARALVAAGTIGPHERIVCLLTGHLLKDPEATLARLQQRAPGERGPDLDSPPVEARLSAIRAALS